MKKSSLIFAIFISLFFIKIDSKKCQNTENCLDKIDETLKKESPTKEKIKQFKDEIKYYLANKTIDIICDNKKLTMNFNGVEQSKGKDEPDADFSVTYLAKFYDKEKLGIDNIQTLLENEEPIFVSPIVKLGNETKEKIEWEVNIKENEGREQIVQVTAEASLYGNSELFVYDSFTFKYVKDRNLEFWIIFYCMIGMIIIVYCFMIILLKYRGEIEKSQLKVDEAGEVRIDSERPTMQDNSGVTS